jgi:hypothetical protein
VQVKNLMRKTQINGDRQNFKLFPCCSFCKSADETKGLRHRKVYRKFHFGEMTYQTKIKSNLVPFMCMKLLARLQSGIILIPELALHALYIYVCM